MKEKDIPNGHLYPGKVKRLAISMTKHGYRQADALAFIASAEGISDKDKPSIARWFSENLPKLEPRPDYQSICEGCACCLGGKRLEEAKRIHAEEPSLAARINRLLSAPDIMGFWGEKISETTFEVRFFGEQAYYRCPCLKFEKGQQEAPLPEGYCYCCAGHLKHHIQKALGCPVEVTFLTGSLTTMGRESCRFRVDIQI